MKKNLKKKKKIQRSKREFILKTPNLKYDHCYRVVLHSIPFHSCVFHLLLRTLAPTSINLFISLLNLRTHSGSFKIATLFTNGKLTKFKSFFSILYIFTQKIYNQNTVFIAMDCIFFFLLCGCGIHLIHSLMYLFPVK